MLQRILWLTICVMLTACGINQNDANLRNQSLTNNMNLLEQDKEEGVTRKLTRYTQETVDTDNNIHQKTVEMNEEVQMNGAVGKAQSKTIYDSASRQRTGERSLTIQDDGMVSLSEFVQKFEAAHIADDKKFVAALKEDKKDDSEKKDDATFVAQNQNQEIETDNTATASVVKSSTDEAPQIQQQMMQPIADDVMGEKPVAKPIGKTSSVVKEVQKERKVSKLSNEEIKNTVSALYAVKNPLGEEAAIKEIAFHDPQELHSDL